MVFFTQIIIFITIKCFSKDIHVNNFKMLSYDKIVVSKGIDVNKTSASKDCITCHYWYLLDEESKFQPNTCNVRNGYRYVLMMSRNLNNIAILNIFGVEYRCPINGISRSEAINFLQKVDLTTTTTTKYWGIEIIYKYLLNLCKNG